MEWLAPRLRAADVREIEVLGGTPYEALYTSYRTSTEAWTAREHGVIGAMFGVRGDALGRIGIIWALGTDRLSANPVRLIKEVGGHVERWGREYRVLTNVVHEENEASMKLLRHLGFSFEPERPGVLRFWRT